MPYSSSLITCLLSRQHGNNSLIQVTRTQKSRTTTTYRKTFHREILYSQPTEQSSLYEISSIKLVLILTFCVQCIHRRKWLPLFCHPCNTVAAIGTEPGNNVQEDDSPTLSGGREPWRLLVHKEHSRSFAWECTWKLAMTSNLWLASWSSLLAKIVNGEGVMCLTNTCPSSTLWDIFYGRTCLLQASHGCPQDGWASSMPNNMWCTTASAISALMAVVARFKSWLSHFGTACASPVLPQAQQLYCVVANISSKK